MPTLDQNMRAWDETYKWIDQGDEWSRAWGGPSAQWFGTILPRLRSFVPAKTILEIAPGYGRWTQFLRELCQNLILVDISPKCIEVCRTRFAAFTGIEYHVNDGQSLAMIGDDSIDLAFSFDSLVHVELDVLLGYLAQLAHKLTPDGVAFIHHSNIGEFVDESTGKLPPEIVNRHWRALSVSAEKVERACEGLGLRCVSQELINWGGTELIDSFTVVSQPGARWSGETVLVRNTEFNAEVKYVRRLAALYDWGRMARGASLPEPQVSDPER